MKEDKTPRTLQNQAFERAKNPKTLNAGTPHDWEDLYQNTEAWQNSSDGWVKTMTQSKENKELYQEYVKITNNPIAYRDWLKEKENGTTTSSTKTSK